MMQPLAIHDCAPHTLLSCLLSLLQVLIAAQRFIMRGLGECLTQLHSTAVMSKPRLHELQLSSLQKDNTKICRTFEHNVALVWPSRAATVYSDASYTGSLKCAAFAQFAVPSSYNVFGSYQEQIIHRSAWHALCNSCINMMQQAHLGHHIHSLARSVRATT